MRVIFSSNILNSKFLYYHHNLLAGFDGNVRRPRFKCGTRARGAPLFGKTSILSLWPTVIYYKRFFRKIGGFGLPFYVIGIGMILLGPLNMVVIPKIESKFY